MKYTQAIALHKNGSLIKEGGTKLWKVDEPFVWYLCYMTKEYKVEIEEGFETDFGSIPRILQNIFSPTKYVSYILHDKLYSNNRVWKVNSPGVFESKELTRKECDMVLLEGLNLEGAGILEKLFVYIGVRIGGWLFFNK